MSQEYRSEHQSSFLNLECLNTVAVGVLPEPGPGVPIIQPTCFVCECEYKIIKIQNKIKNIFNKRVEYMCIGRWGENHVSNFTVALPMAL